MTGFFWPADEVHKSEFDAAAAQSLADAEAPLREAHAQAVQDAQEAERARAAAERQYAAEAARQLVDGAHDTAVGSVDRERAIADARALVDGAHDGAVTQHAPPAVAPVDDPYEIRGQQRPDTAAGIHRAAAAYPLPSVLPPSEGIPGIPGSAVTERRSDFSNEPVDPVTNVAAGALAGAAKQVGRVVESGEALSDPQTIARAAAGVGTIGMSDQERADFAQRLETERGNSPEVAAGIANATPVDTLKAAGHVANVLPIPSMQAANFEVSALRDAALAAGVPETVTVNGIEVPLADLTAMALQAGGPGAARLAGRATGLTGAVASAGRGAVEEVAGAASHFLPDAAQATAGAAETVAPAVRTLGQRTVDFVRNPQNQQDVIDAGRALIEGKPLAALERIPLSGRQMAGGVAGNVIGGIAGVASAPEDATPEELARRGVLGAVVGTGVGTRGVGFLERVAETKAARDVAAGRLGIIGNVLNAPAADAAGRILSREERVALGGAPKVPLPKLNAQGEAMRKSLIEWNVRHGGYGLDDAADLVDHYITTLAGTGQLPASLVLPADQRSLVVRANDIVGTYGRWQLLSSPLTHIRNIVGNAVTMPFGLAERLIAPLIEPLWRATGKTADPRYAGEAGALVRGWWSSLAAAGGNFVDVLRHGDEPLTAAITGNVAGGKLERALDVGFRPLTAADAFFRTLAEGGELYTQAFREARAAGKTGAALDAEVLRLVQRPSAAMVHAAEQAGAYSTFSQAMDRTGEVLDRVGKLPGMQFVVPFVRVPFNVVKYGLERSPWGAVAVGRAALDKSVTSGDAADRTARLLIGGVMSAAFFKHALDGNVAPSTWPTSQTERDAWNAEGKNPGYVRIGGSWWDLRSIPGVGESLATAGGLAEASRALQEPDASWTKEAQRFTLTMANTLAQKPLLDGLSGLMGAINDPDRADSYLERLGATVASQVIPGSAGLGWGTRITDPYQREAHGVGERVQSRIPPALGALSGGYIPSSDKLPIKRDAFGREMLRDQTGLEAALNPFARSPERDGIRRYQGSGSADEDTKIAAAINRVDAWKSKPRENPRPSGDDMLLWTRFHARESRDWQRLRAEERKR